jgi:hypothetical protein
MRRYFIFSPDLKWTKTAEPGASAATFSHLPGTVPADKEAVWNRTAVKAIKKLVPFTF